MHSLYIAFRSALIFSSLFSERTNTPDRGDEVSSGRIKRDRRRYDYARVISIFGMAFERERYLERVLKLSETLNAIW